MQAAEGETMRLQRTGNRQPALSRGSRLRWGFPITEI